MPAFIFAQCEIPTMVAPQPVTRGSLSQPSLDVLFRYVVGKSFLSLVRKPPFASSSRAVYRALGPGLSSSSAYATGSQHMPGSRPGGSQLQAANWLSPASALTVVRVGLAVRHRVPFRSTFTSAMASPAMANDSFCLDGHQLPALVRPWHR